MTNFNGNQCQGKQFIGAMTRWRDQITTSFLSLKAPLIINGGGILPSAPVQLRSHDFSAQ